MKILIVEDDAVMMMIFKVMVKKLGHSVICAQEGLEAIDLIETTRPDLVITDMMLAGATGPEIVRYLKGFPKKIPVILVSSMLKIALKNPNDNFGADAYLEKPVSMDILKKYDWRFKQSCNELRRQ